MDKEEQIQLGFNLIKIGPPENEGRFCITCRGCDGKGKIDLVFGGPPRNPCDYCGGAGIQYVDKLTADEWRRKRNLVTDIKGICKDCHFWHKLDGFCEVIEDEAIEGDTTRVIRHSPGSATHLHDFERNRKPHDSCDCHTNRCKHMNETYVCQNSKSKNKSLKCPHGFNDVECDAYDLGGGK